MKKWYLSTPMTETAKGNNEPELMEVIRNYGIENQKLEKKLATAVEALKDLVSAQEQLWTSINGKVLVDKAMDNAKEALAEIGGEDE